MTPAGEVIWICDACDNPIGDGDGHLYISVAEAAQCAEVHREWEAQWRGRLVPLGAFMDLPLPAHWQVTHRDCDLDELVSYAIGVERARTTGQLLAWTLHLQEKNWYSATDWPSFIRDHTGVTSAAVMYA